VFGPPIHSLLVMNPFPGKQIVDAHIRELRLFLLFKISLWLTTPVNLMPQHARESLTAKLYNCMLWLSFRPVPVPDQWKNNFNFCVELVNL